MRKTGTAHEQNLDAIAENLKSIFEKLEKISVHLEQLNKILDTTNKILEKHRLLDDIKDKQSLNPFPGMKRI